jgi:hypothetical protein
LASDGAIIFACASLPIVASPDGHRALEAFYGSLDPLSRGQAEAGRLVALQAPHIAFHAEFFLDKADRTLRGRLPAGRFGIADMIEVVHGFNLYEQWVRRSFALPIELPNSGARGSAGSLLIPPRPGRLRALPAETPFDWVVDYRPNSAPDKIWQAPSFSTANIASFIIAGRDAADVEARMRLLDRWFRMRVGWDEDAQIHRMQVEA